MRTEDQIKQALRAAANGIEPPVSEIVSAGLTRGRHYRRRRIAAMAGGIVVASAAVVGGAVALPGLLASPPDPVADGSADSVDRMDTQAAPETSPSGQALVIEEVESVVGGAELQALLEDVVALTNGTLDERLDGGTENGSADVLLDFPDLGTGKVSAFNGFTMLEEHSDPCLGGSPACTVVLDEETGFVVQDEAPEGSFLAYVASTGSDWPDPGTALMVRAATADVPDGTALHELGFDDATAFRDAILAVAPDAEKPGREPFTIDELNEIAAAVANLSTASSGELSEGLPPGLSGIGAHGLVLVEGVEAFDLSVGYIAGMDVEAWRGSCSPETYDGKPCNEVLGTDDTALFYQPYSTQAGRESVRYVANLDGGSLTIEFNNYIETASGEKLVGPSWTEAGLDADSLANVVEASGILDD